MCLHKHSKAPLSIAMAANRAENEKYWEQRVLGTSDATLSNPASDLKGILVLMECAAGFYASWCPSFPEQTIQTARLVREHMCGLGLCAPCCYPRMVGQKITSDQFPSLPLPVSNCGTCYSSQGFVRNKAPSHLFSSQMKGIHLCVSSRKITQTFFVRIRSHGYIGSKLELHQVRVK